MKITHIQKFLFEDGTTVEFFPVGKDYPGCAAKVIVNGVRRDWLSNTFRPNQKTARFFYEKHRAD